MLGIVALSLNHFDEKKGTLFAPEDRYYDSNEWYALSKSDKDEVLKARSDRKGDNKASKSEG